MRSITQPERDHGGGEGLLRDEASLRDELRLGPLHWGLAIAALCLVVFIFSNLDRVNFYQHFVWQAQAWLEGQASIPLGVPRSATSPGDSWYQDTMPVLNAAGQPTGRGIIPFPPLPALALLPFVAIWHLWTNEQLLAAILGAIDVGLGYWLLGYLPVRPLIRGLTTLFLGLGTVLWYAAAIGTTWYWAHLVAVGCLILAIGLALSADRLAVEAEPPGTLLAGMRPAAWPGGQLAGILLVALAALGLLALALAGAGAPAAELVAVAGLIVVLLFPLAAAVVGGWRAVLVPAAAFVVLGLAVVALVASERYPALAAGAGGVVVAGGLAAAALAAGPTERSRLRAGFVEAARRPEVRQIAAGFLFGLAVTARLTIAFGFPFFVLVGGGASWLRRALLAAIGAATPAIALLLYTYASTGHLFDPAYDYLYRLELGYTFLHYHASWAITDVRYIPQNLGIFLFGLPQILPSALNYGTTQVCTAGQARGLFDPSCPLAVPDPVGMSILLTSPAYLLAPFAFLTARLGRLDRATLGAAVAVVAIELANLTHFSQGWVQFGYRFSLDFAPFALLLVALGASRLKRPGLLAGLVAVSIAVNLWGTIWGVTLGW